jgi:hypothetical protein
MQTHHEFCVKTTFFNDEDTPVYMQPFFILAGINPAL